MIKKTKILVGTIEELAEYIEENYINPGLQIDSAGHAVLLSKKGLIDQLNDVLLNKNCIGNKMTLGMIFYLSPMKTEQGIDLELKMIYLHIKENIFYHNKL